MLCKYLTTYAPADMEKPMGVFYHAIYVQSYALPLRTLHSRLTIAFPGTRTVVFFLGACGDLTATELSGTLACPSLSRDFRCGEGPTRLVSTGLSLVLPCVAT